MSERSWSGSNGEAAASGPALSESRVDLSEPVGSDSGCDNYGDRATELVSACVNPERATTGLDARQLTPTEDDLKSHRIGFDLRLMSELNDVSRIPTEGKNLVVVAAVDQVLHFRIFDGDGKMVVDMDQKRLTERVRPLEDLRNQLLELVASPRADQEREGPGNRRRHINHLSRPSHPLRLG